MKTLILKAHKMYVESSASATQSDSPFPAQLPFRLTLHRSPEFRLDYFEFEITTADPEISATGDKHDAFAELRSEPGTPRERLIRACLLMLCDPHRISRKGYRRLTANPNWRQRHDMNDADPWRLAMRVIEPETSALQ